MPGRTVRHCTHYNSLNLLTCFASFTLQSYLNDLSKLGDVDGLNSGIYSLLTAAFVGAGIAYIGAPAQVRSRLSSTNCGGLSLAVLLSNHA